jgi:hypothetical protein
MRKRLIGAMVTLLVTSPLVAAVGLSASPAQAAASESYTWKNAEIVGGGFVPGIIFSPAQKDLIYARTDIGGLYRWNAATSRWIPLLDWVGQKNWGYNGVVSVAPDPTDANKVYAAVGMYTNDWDPNNGAIIRSGDKGNTWQVTPLPFKLGGNMPGRGMGERLAVDPNKPSILYFGAPSGKGLWKSTDSGATWAQVANFPNVGNYVQDPSNAYTADNQGVVWVTFDPSSGSAGSATPAIYVGVADKANTVYRSTNGGTSWERIAGQPTGYMAHKGVIDPTNHLLYIATSDTGGPYDGAKGDVWKYNTQTGAWTQISPIPSSSSDDYFGPDHRPAAPGHDHGRHADLLVAGRHHVPQHRLRGDLDADLGLHQLPQPQQALHDGHQRLALADLQRQPAAAGGGAEAGLDDGVVRDRPVQLRPRVLRHRRHDLRDEQPDGLGLRRHDRDQAGRPGPGGDRGPRPDQPAVRRPAGQRPR